MGNVAWSKEDQVYVAHSSRYPSISTHGDSATEALKELEEVERMVERDIKAAGEYTNADS